MDTDIGSASPSSSCVTRVPRTSRSAVTSALVALPLVGCLETEVPPLTDPPPVIQDATPAERLAVALDEASLHTTQAVDRYCSCVVSLGYTSVAECVHDRGGYLYVGRIECYAGALQAKSEDSVWVAECRRDAAAEYDRCVSGEGICQDPRHLVRCDESRSTDIEDCGSYPATVDGQLKRCDTLWMTIVESFAMQRMRVEERCARCARDSGYDRTSECIEDQAWSSSDQLCIENTYFAMDAPESSFVIDYLTCDAEAQRAHLECLANDQPCDTNLPACDLAYQNARALCIAEGGLALDPLQLCM